MDHHSSREALDAMILWEVYKILLLLIPAHSSHITQPLDQMKTILVEEIGFFKSAQEY